MEDPDMLALNERGGIAVPDHPNRGGVTKTSEKLLAETHNLPSSTPPLPSISISGPIAAPLPRAKLEANARRSANGSLSAGGVLKHGQKLNSSALLAGLAPAPHAPAPKTSPRPQMRLSDMGASRPRPTLGKLPGATDSPFANFSKIVDPNGRLNFEGKAILHASGVEFKNGTSFSINMDELKLLEQLGHGNYGTVSLARHTRTNVLMALKEIRLELDEAKLNAIIMELDILHRAIAPQIVEFYGAFFIESCVYYCMEYMDAGSLDKLCNGRRNCVPEPVLARIASSTVRGLSFLKDELQIIHRDIKPTNILVNRKGEVKLCDFGVSGQLEKSLAKTNIGCQSYMAPERIKGDSRNRQTAYTTASDVWSFGLTLVELTMGTYPYPPETFSNVFAQLRAIVDDPAPGLPEPSTEPVTVLSNAGTKIDLVLGDCVYSDLARDLVAQCLRKSPDERPTYAELLEHPLLVADAERTDEEIGMAAWVASSLEAQAARRSEHDHDAQSVAVPES
ncbi:mitogen-activated protein kinase kinase [Malassezia cuniculi]|uniref:mitogen-activated protein kinase kinase n=1 Tax=Malassezia cuniculi TaxID=948313 RepID=A0AAF0ETI7_9BASI|nr:mitogen-activated protein kinase kinase [Malassezia cuniculi]